MAFMLALVFALAGCSTSTGKPSGDAPTREFIDDMGRHVDIPTNPQNVVLCEFSPIALTIGLKPAAVCNNDFLNSFTKASLEGIESVGDPPNVEKIVSISPDLMVFSSVYPKIYREVMDQIEKIAPVVYVNFTDPIYDVFPKVADALGKKSQVEDWIKGFEADRTGAREKIKQAIGDETVSILRIAKGDLRVYLSTNFGGYVVRNALQAKAVAKVQAEIDKDRWKNAVAISHELLPEYAGDHLLLIVEDEEQYKEIQQMALWKGLPAVKNGQVYLLEAGKYYNSDIITIRETMKEVADLLASGKSK